MADSSISDGDFFEKGRRWIETHGSATPGWARVWGFFAAPSDGDRELLARGWEWMDAKYFHRRSWPVVWTILWTREPEEHLRLATLAADWVIDQRGRRANDITNWHEVVPLVDDVRSQAIRAILKIPA